VKSFPDLIASVRTELPAPPLARWASMFFSLSVLTFLVSLAASQAFLAAAGVCYAAHLLRDRPTVHFPPVGLPLALFCLATVLSVLWATNPAAGGYAVRKLVLFLIFLLGANLVTSRRHFDVLYRGLFLESALAGLVATGQFGAQYHAVRALHPDRIYFHMTAERVSGFMGHWMNFGGQQMLIFATLLAFLLLVRCAPAGASPAPETNDGVDATPKGGATDPRISRLWWLVVAIVTLSIVLNFTRGVWLGCFVASIYLVARWRARWLWALPAFLLAGYLAAPTMVRQRVKVLCHPSADPALSIRFEMWQVAWRIIQKHPWLGVGPNNIEQVYVLYLPPGKVPERGYHEHFHNNLLQLGAERGLPCLAAWVWLMTALGWHFCKLRRKLAGGRWVADAALAAWLAFVVEGLFEFNFGTSPVLMVFLFLMAAPFVAERQ